MGAGVDVADILRSAADLIEPEGAWTKGAFARCNDGIAIFYTSPDACSWCVSGAIRKVAEDSMIEAQFVLNHFARYVRCGVVSRWNDVQNGPEPILAALRGAAKELKP
jgi:hypothetical protein